MFDNEDSQDYAAPKLEYIINSNTGIDVFLRSGEVKSITGSHPNFEKLREALIADGENLSDEKVNELIDFGFAIGAKLESLSDRVRFDGANIFFDGDTVHNTLSDHILRMLEDKNPRLGALVKFMENLSLNPSEKSKQSLYDWITNLENKDEKLTITKDGMLLAYKGVLIDSEGVSRSIHSGPGIVDGVSMNCQLPNREGSVVEIPRSYVDDNTAVGCSRGLHAGTWAYAHSFARGRTLEVEINPRDVVSVPDDCEFQKLRVSRYVVLKETDAPETLPVFHESVDWTAEEIEQWEEAGHDLDDAANFQDEGYTYEEALEIVDEGYDEDDYDDEDYYGDEDENDSETEESHVNDDSVETAEERYTPWLNAGFTIAEADGWLSLGYSVEDALSDIEEDDEIQKGDCPEEASDAETQETEEPLVVSSFTEAFADAPATPKKGKKKNKKKNKKRNH